MRKLLNKLNFLLEKKLKVSIIILLICIIIGSLAEVVGVAIVLPIVNLALDSDFESNIWCKLVTNITGATDKESILLILIGATVFIYVIKNLYLSWMYSRLYYTAAVIKRSMAVKLMKAYMKQPYAFFLNKNSSELIRSVSNDTGRLYEVIVNVLQITSCALTAIALLITLIVTSPLMTLVVASLLGFCALLIILFIQKRTRRYGRENQRLEATLIQIMQQTFGGIKEVKILQSEEYFVNTYEEAFSNQNECVRKYNMSNTIPKYLIEMVCISGILVYLGFNVLYNPNYLEIIPQLAIFVVAAYKLMPTVNSMYAYMNSVIYHKVAVDLVYNDVMTATKLPDNYEYTFGEHEKLEFNEKIELKNISFSYEGADRKILDDTTIVIPKGKSVAFIGPSGGGKTTTADIVLGLLYPTEGHVLVDNIDITTNMSGWRSQIGYIPQTIFLADDTIRRNIAWGIEDDKIEDGKIWEAIKQAQLEDFVKSLESGLDTVVGERGDRISGGQRQRIGIARALYRNPEVLVFDEATSALDTETEKEVMESIDALQGTKTMIMIAHRLSTIENCDIVYKVENGTIKKEH